MFFTPLLPGGVIGTDTGTLRRQVKAKINTQQPRGVAQVDWSNPVNKELSLAFVGGMPVDLTRKYSLVPAAKISTSVNSAGISSIGSPSNYYNVIPPLPDSGTEFSIVATVRYEAVLEQGYLSKTKVTVSPGQWDFIVNTTGKVRLEVLAATNGNVVGATTLVAGRVYTIAATYKSGAVSIYVNGVLDGTGTLPALTPTGVPFTTLLKHDNNFAATGGVNFLAVWNNRALSPAEIRKVSNNVWGTFKSTPQTMVATRGIVSRPNSDLTVTNNTITIRRQIKVKRKTQPNQSMTIDWSNPITAGLIFAYNGVTNTDLVKRAKGDKQNIAVDSIGKGTNITGSADVVTISARNNTPVTNNLSFFSLFTTTTSPNTQSATNFYTSLFCKRDSINPERISFYFSGGTLNIVANDSLGVSQQIQLSGGVSSTGRTTACATGSINGSVGYINGKQTGTGIATYWPAGTSTWKIGLGRADAPTETLTCIHHLDLCWNRTLTATEVASLDANPWQLFKSTPVLAMVYTKPGGGWSYNSNTSLYDAIDEPSYNDTDAIISPNLNTSPEPAKFGLDRSLDAGTYNINVRARRTDTTGDIRATLIDSAGNVVGTSSWQTLTDIYQTYFLSVTTTATASRVGLEVRA